jgi:hypothetical protein
MLSVAFKHIMLSVVMLSVIVLTVAMRYPECRYAGYRESECDYLY